MTEPARVRGETTPGPTVLEVEGLRKTFVAPDGERVTVLDVAHYALARGEQAALHGGSGTGKTTFLHVIAGILTPDAGRVRVAGEDVTGAREPARDRIRARHVGYVFQVFHLLQGYSALENVLLAMGFAGRLDVPHARELLARVGLADRMDHRPAQLSVGQQQRVALARALANRPALVLADEPTGNLDPRNADAALELLREACRENEAALLLVSHDAGVLERFDRVQELADLDRAAAAPPRGRDAEGVR